MNTKGDKNDRDTPCIGICSTTQPGSKICSGCFRTAEEVIHWNTYSDSEKIKINQRVKPLIEIRGRGVK